MELAGGKIIKMNRRSFLSTAAIAATSMTIHSANAASQQAVYPTLGDSRDVFEAWFGIGTPVSDFVQFPQYAPGYPIYYARFVENRSVQVVGNFQTPDTPNGLQSSIEDGGISPFVPAGALSTQLYIDGILAGPSLIRVWSGGPSLSGSNADEQIIVMDTLADQYRPIYTQTRVSYPVPEVTTLAPSSANDWLNTDEMWTSISRLQPAQGGNVVASPPLPGQFMISNGKIQAWFDSPISVSIVTDYLATILIPSRIMSTTWFPADPLSVAGMRFREFETIETSQRFMCLLVIDGDEQTGTVSRFTVVAGEGSNVQR